MKVPVTEIQRKHWDDHLDRLNGSDCYNTLCFAQAGCQIHLTILSVDCRYVRTYARTRTDANGKTHTKAPKIQRLVTPITLQRKRRRIAEKKNRIARVSGFCLPCNSLLTVLCNRSSAACTEPHNYWFSCVISKWRWRKRWKVLMLGESLTKMFSSVHLLPWPRSHLIELDQCCWSAMWWFLWVIHCS